MEMLPVYLLLVLVFADRYFLGRFLAGVRAHRLGATRADYEPTVSVVIPVFNEGASIYQTIASVLALDYPKSKLEVIVVDDASSDDSLTFARRAEREHENVTVLASPVNQGKRAGINRAVERSQAEIIVSVDSDVCVDRQALRRLVARFTRPEIGAVGGRVRVWNAHENWLTRMQTIKYHFGYEYLKNLERAFESVMCLSGCLTAYRRTVLEELRPVLERRALCGVPIRYGEDRFLTRQIIKAGYRTLSVTDAVCKTKVPTTLRGYFAQQLRWRRSNLVDFLGALSHLHRLQPLVAVHYVSLFALLCAYPLVVAGSLASGQFLPLAAFHGALLAGFGLVYVWQTRRLPRVERVSALWFLPMAVVMPVTYLLLTPLAVLTLDSSSWETRGAGAAAAGGAP